MLYNIGKSISMYTYIWRYTYIKLSYTNFSLYEKNFMDFQTHLYIHDG